MAQPQPRTLYRAYLQHLRLLPDPHLWAVLQPRFKALVRRANVGADHSRNNNNGDDDNDIRFDRILSQVNGETAAESSQAALAREEKRRLRSEQATRRAHKSLNRLRAAVASHPHALSRLLDEVYAQRGVARWDVLRNIQASYSHLKLDKEPISLTASPIPPPLLPLRSPAIVADTAAQPRARRVTPSCVLRARERRALERDWALCGVPLVLRPPSVIAKSDRTGDREGEGIGEGGGNGTEIHGAGLVETGWEATPILHNLHILAGLEYEPSSSSLSQSGASTASPSSTSSRPRDSASPTTLTPNQASAPCSSRKSNAHEHDPLIYAGLNTSSLPSSIRKIFPRASSPLRKLRVTHEAYPPPAPRHTRHNPRTWSVPHPLTARVSQRAYRRLWDRLEWVRPASATLASSANLASPGSGVQSGLRHDLWEKCSFAQFMAQSQRTDSTQSQPTASKRRRSKDGAAPPGGGSYKWSRATEEERAWLGLDNGVVAK